MENLIKYLDGFEKIPEKSKEKLISLARPLQFKKGNCIAKEGVIHDDIYILESGIVRAYFVDVKKKEQTRNIFMPKRAFGALGGLILNKPAGFSFNCITDCTLYAMNFNDFKLLSERDKNIGNLYAKILEFIFLEQESKINELSALDATERYLKLIRTIPRIENLIPQYLIASYLNITPVQLSRIRRALLKKAV